MRSPLPRVSRRGRVTIAVLAAVLILFVLADRLVDLWTDWLWFSEVDYTSVFTGVLRTKILLFLVFGLVMAAFVGGNLYLAYRLRPLLRGNSLEQHALERYRMLLTPRLGLWIGVFAAVLGMFAGLSAEGHWEQWLLYLNGTDFNVQDPLFHQDIGFYIFDYPFIRYLLDFGFAATTLAIFGSLAVHYLYGGVRLQGAGDRMSTGARAHLTGLIAFFVLLKAAAYFLDQRALVLEFNSGTDLWGAGYTDVNALLPAKEILAYISIVVAIAIVVFSNARMRNLVWAGAALALLGIAAVAIGGIYPAIVQQFTVKPNLRDKEAQYIQRTIEGTRDAYGLTDVKTQPYSGDRIEPPPTLATDTSVVPNIRLLDPAVVSDTFTQYQQIRPFYDFNQQLDVDRYTVGGKLQDYVVGLREINYDSLTGQQTNWQNQHTVLTHGYGFVAAPANKLVCQGAPYFVSGGLLGEHGSTDTAAGCTSDTELIPAAQARVYYGELAKDYVVVGKKDAGASDIEYDRPAGVGQTNFTYTGQGGVSVGSFGRRLLYALHYKEGNFVLSSVFNDNSKLLYVRDPRERVEKVAPFLTLDGDPYPAVVNGKITWILDGYTTAATYPYSQRVDLREASSDATTGAGTSFQLKQNINYIRNSVKATVDAYDGTVTLYQFDKSDPVLQAWNKAFGGNLIKPKESIPPELADHFRYPEDLFKVQRDLLAKFHVSDPREFNTGADFWAVPDDPARHGTTSTGKQPPYYLLTQFPGEGEQTFQLTAALTPNNRPNLAALMTGRYVDGEPTLELLELPREGRTPGPGQAQQNMANDPEARSELNLLQGQGSQSQLVYGNLLSLPFGGGMLYVQPVYLKSSNVTSPFPLMKKVLVSYGEQVAFADTLPQAIDQLVEKGGGQPPTTPPTGQPPTQPPPVSGDLAAAAAKIQAAIDALEVAQRSGDPEAWGKAVKDLSAAVKEFEDLQKKTGATPAPTASPGPTG
jgi:uncharacterized membrane protein (UPF0182 family)